MKSKQRIQYFYHVGSSIITPKLTPYFCIVYETGDRMVKFERERERERLGLGSVPTEFKPGYTRSESVKGQVDRFTVY